MVEKHYNEASWLTLYQPLGGINTSLLSIREDRNVALWHHYFPIGYQEAGNALTSFYFTFSHEAVNGH